MTRKPPPRRHTDTSHLTVCNAIQRRLLADYDVLDTWEAVGAKYGVSGGVVYRVATSDYEPRNNTIRAALGLPKLAPAPVCSCGEVHTRKTCPNRPPRPRKPGLTVRQKKAVKLLGGLWG